MITIANLITQLREMSNKSVLGDKTVVCICVDYVPYQNIARTELDADADGAVALIFPDTDD